MQPFTGIRAQQQQAEVCQNIIKWCKAEKRTFLRQRVDAKLSFILYEQEKYGRSTSCFLKFTFDPVKTPEQQRTR